jgi:hypothetical protein
MMAQYDALYLRPERERKLFEDLILIDAMLPGPNVVVVASDAVLQLLREGLVLHVLAEVCHLCLELHSRRVDRSHQYCHRT